MTIEFHWDEKKSKSNKEKHKIAFSEAKTVFYDDNARIIYDPDHSINEDRFIILGMSNVLNILVVVHCYKDNDSIIRLISARKATKNEKKQYMGYMK